jgi:hypothetical protein
MPPSDRLLHLQTRMQAQILGGDLRRMMDSFCALPLAAIMDKQFLCIVASIQSFIPSKAQERKCRILQL